MKKLFSMMLAVVMACCLFFSASAEGIPMGGGAFTVDLGLEVNQDGLNKVLEMTGATQNANVPTEAIGAVVGILNNLSLKVVAEGQAVQLDVQVKDTPIVNVAGKMDENGLTVVTDLLPNYAATISGEELEQMIKQIMSSNGVNLDFSQIDTQYISNLVMQALSPALMKIMTSFGPEEAGAWTFEGAEFTARKQLNMTTKELLTTVLEAASTIVSDAKVQELLGNFGIRPEQLDMTSTLQNLQNTDEADMPELTVYQYANAAGDMFVTVDLLKDGQGYMIQAGTVGGTVVAHINTNPDAMEIDFMAQQNGEFELFFGMNVQAMGGRAPFNTMEVLVNGIPEGESYEVKIKYSIDKADLLTLKMLFAQGGEITASFDTAGKKVLTLQDIMALAQGQDSETLSALQGEVTTVAMQLLGKLATLMPDEISQIMSLTSQMGR